MSHSYWDSWNWTTAATAKLDFSSRVNQSCHLKRKRKPRAEGVSFLFVNLQIKCYSCSSIVYTVLAVHRSRRLRRESSTGCPAYVRLAPPCPPLTNPLPRLHTCPASLTSALWYPTRAEKKLLCYQFCTFSSHCPAFAPCSQSSCQSVFLHFENIFLMEFLCG